MAEPVFDPAPPADTAVSLDGAVPVDTAVSLDGAVPVEGAVLDGAVPDTAVPADAVDPVPEPPADPLLSLVEAAAGGDERSFSALVEATYRDVFTLARRLTGDDEDARDVTQEVYLRVYRAVGSFRGEAQVSTWMYRITANCAATYLGRRSRHRHEELPSGDVADTSVETDPAMRIDAHDTRARLIDALDDLPPKLRAVVVLRDVYELPHEVIGQELGISATAAKVRLHRARKRLRSALHPELDEVASRAL